MIAVVIRLRIRLYEYFERLGTSLFDLVDSPCAGRVRTIPVWAGDRVRAVSVGFGT
jgi:hypothetical protein